MIKAVLEISNLTFNNKSVNKNDILNINIAFAEYAQPIISPGFRGKTFLTTSLNLKSSTDLSKVLPLTDIGSATPIL